MSANYETMDCNQSTKLYSEIRDKIQYLKVLDQIPAEYKITFIELEEKYQKRCIDMSDEYRNAFLAMEKAIAEVRACLNFGSDD